MRNAILRFFLGLRVAAAGMTITLVSSAISHAWDGQPMSFALQGNGGNCNGCEWIVAEGEIDDQTVERFLAFVGQNGFCGAVMLHSPGGNLREGMELGREFRRLGCSTSVGRSVPLDGTPWEQAEPGLCASACVIAFLGGKERYVEPGQLGVHQFYLAPETLHQLGDPGAEYGIARGQFVQALVVSYLIEMGIDPNIVTAMVSAGPSDVHWLTEDELTQWNVDNMTERRKPWWIEPYKEGAVALMQSTYGEQPTDTLTLFCRREEEGRVYLMLSHHFSCQVLDEMSISLAFAGGSQSTWSASELGKGPGTPTIRVGKEGPAFISIPLTSDQVGALLNGESFSIGADGLGHVCGFGSSIRAAFDEESRPAAALVLRNCI